LRPRIKTRGSPTASAVGSISRRTSKQLWILFSTWVLISCLHGVALGAGANIPPSLLLANELGPRINVAKYLVSEKYDGARAIWDGKVLRFRSGRLLKHPDGLLASAGRCRRQEPVT